MARALPLVIRLSDAGLKRVGYGFHLRGEPYSGIGYEQHPNGRLGRLAVFWRGRKVLKEYQWYSNGSRLGESTYDFQGRRHGDWMMWHPDGRPKSLTHYINDQSHGEQWAWHPNGTLVDCNVHDSGQTVTQKAWIYDGTPYYNYFYQDGEAVGVKGGGLLPAATSGHTQQGIQKMRPHQEHQRLHHWVAPIVQFPDVTWKDQNDQTQSLEFLKGKRTIAAFFFSTCSGFCPMLVQKMKKMQSALKDHPDLQFLGITVDPELDTPARLKIFAQYQGIKDPRTFKLLTADQATINLLVRDTFASQVVARKNTDLRSFAHSEHFYLLDEQARLRGILNGTRIDAPDEARKMLVMLSDAAAPRITEKLSYQTTQERNQHP